MPRKDSRRKPPQVEVVWVDACGYDDVHGTLGHILDRARPVTRRTAGYLLYVDRHRVVLAHDYDAPALPDDEPEYGNITVLISGWVLAIRALQGAVSREVKGSVGAGALAGAEYRWDVREGGSFVSRGDSGTSPSLGPGALPQEPIEDNSEKATGEPKTPLGPDG